MDAEAADAEAAPPSKPGRSDLLLGHCLVLEAKPRPTARQRLEAVLGPELTRRLIQALSTPR
jgi:hypothetical protein